MKSLVLFITLFFTSAIFAQSQINLATIEFDKTSDMSHMSAVVFVEIDENNTILNFGKRVYENGTLISEGTIEGELNSDGIVIEEIAGQPVAILKSDNFDKIYGGPLVLDYLYNGISGERREFHMSLDIEADVWGLYKENKVINRLMFIINKSFFGNIGIKDILAK